MGLRTLDLFSGAGGLSAGLEWSGKGVVQGAVELDSHAAATFSRNHPDARVWVQDIRTLTPEEVQSEIGQVDLILGGPMCQGVSQRGPRDPRDERNFAFWAFANYVRVLRPSFFIMENVPAIASDVHNRSLAIGVFEELESLGYQLSVEAVNAAWLGVPQLRYRMIVMGSLEWRPSFPQQVRDGVAGAIPESSYVTIGDALMDLPSVEAGGGRDQIRMPKKPAWASPYASMMRKGARVLFNHWSADTDEVNLKRIRTVPEGGNWHDIPFDLLPTRFRYVRPSDHTTTYRRLHRAHAAHTITTECGNVTSGAFTHPTQDRAITVREAARLQGFPDSFRFVGPRNSQYRQVGNAVPPLLAKQLIDALLTREVDDPYHGRLSLDLLRQYPTSRLPLTLAPRYKPLFGKSTNAVRRRANAQRLDESVYLETPVDLETTIENAS